jgi:hypothetical protein
VVSAFRVADRNAQAAPEAAVQLTNIQRRESTHPGRSPMPLL